ncbi:phage regulatory CII family protein [Desulfoluna sp.]|uniref:phage regulatory CII family protein n=1 Tax=Desulfoluna sp. TaxID=2045199 RepID=UPI00260F4AB1|nr:phage regulatory CII family protein [Desulfoluna sp.]
MYRNEFIGLLEGIQRDVKAHGVRVLAERLSVRPQTLYADVDPQSVGRRTNKLGLLDWMVVLEETRNLNSLDEVNRHFGRISLPIPESTDEMNAMSWMQCCATIAKESAEAIKVLADGLSNDGDLDAGELADCEKETWEALQAFGALYLAIQTKRKEFKIIQAGANR